MKKAPVIAICMIFCLLSAACTMQESLPSLGTPLHSNPSLPMSPSTPTPVSPVDPIAETLQGTWTGAVFSALPEDEPLAFIHVEIDSSTCWLAYCERYCDFSYYPSKSELYACAFEKVFTDELTLVPQTATSIFASIELSRVSDTQFTGTMLSANGEAEYRVKLERPESKGNEFTNAASHIIWEDKRDDGALTIWSYSGYNSAGDFTENVVSYRDANANRHIRMLSQAVVEDVWLAEDRYVIKLRADGLPEFAVSQAANVTWQWYLTINPETGMFRDVSEQYAEEYATIAEWAKMVTASPPTDKEDTERQRLAKGILLIIGDLMQGKRMDCAPKAATNYIIMHEPDVLTTDLSPPIPPSSGLAYDQDQYEWLSYSMKKARPYFTESFYTSVDLSPEAFMEALGGEGEHDYASLVKAYNSIHPLYNQAPLEVLDGKCRLVSSYMSAPKQVTLSDEICRFRIIDIRPSDPNYTYYHFFFIEENDNWQLRLVLPGRTSHKSDQDNLFFVKNESGSCAWIMQNDLQGSGTGTTIYEARWYNIVTGNMDMRYISKWDEWANNSGYLEYIRVNHATGTISGLKMGEDGYYSISDTPQVTVDTYIRLVYSDVTGFPERSFRYVVDYQYNPASRSFEMRDINFSHLEPDL